MKKELQELLQEIVHLRRNVPQCVLFAGIFPDAVIAMRKEIVAFKMKFPDVKEVDLIINSGGGIADDAYRIIRTLRMNFETVNIIVPFWAKSAATLLALGGNRIVMDEFGEFGPLDAQIGKPREDSPLYERVSALNDEHSVSAVEDHFSTMCESLFLQFYKHDDINIPKDVLSEQVMKNLSTFFKPIVQQIDPYTLGEKRRILDIGAQYAGRILKEYGAPSNDASRLRALIKYLIHECPDHGYVIDRSVMENFLSNVESPESFAGKDYARLIERISLVFMPETADDVTTAVGFLDFVPIADQLPNAQDTITAEGGKSQVQVDQEGEIHESQKA